MVTLLEARRSAGIRTQEDLVKILREEEGISLHYSSISLYENGKATPRKNTGKAIVRILRRRGIRANYAELFGFIEESSNEQEATHAQA